MLTVKEAKEKLFRSIAILGTEKRDVAKCLGYILSADIRSQFDIPRFDDSAVDGYALFLNEIEDREELVLNVTGEIKAGDKPVVSLKKNSAIRIFTGAPVPANAYCVVMQERVVSGKEQVIIPPGTVIPGGNIRKKGSQIRKGEFALKMGTRINAAAIGFLCTLGLKHVNVSKKPIVGVLSTGNELRSPGEKLLPGQIYESNSFMLAAALEQTGFRAFRISRVTDHKNLLLRKLKTLISECDVVIISGGISVGKYDLVKESLDVLGIKEILYNVSQKPGKPIYVGKKGKQMMFALPGNPAASLVCFYEYVLPALNKMSGFKDFELKKVILPLTESYFAKGDRALFLKARAGENEVRILDGQESNILRSFAEANALVYIPVTGGIIEKGDKVEVHLLPVC